MHVTGNETEALAMGDRMIVLEAGRAIQIDKPSNIFTQPATVGVARAVNNYNALEGRVTNGLFNCENHDLALPGRSTEACYYVIRFDKVSMNPTGTSVGEGLTGFDAEFIASEFMGSRVIYFFSKPGGGVFEVERHLSREEPIRYEKGQRMTLSWPTNEVILYNAGGELMKLDDLERAS